jgi:hypothetical protein
VQEAPRRYRGGKVVDHWEGSGEGLGLKKEKDAVLQEALSSRRERLKSPLFSYSAWRIATTYTLLGEVHVFWNDLE